uniref:EF-hand domain-containing protein n=1 Tax=Trichuris muris TaxID=70415 RepID=A0A5S6R386_TRIMR
MSQHSSPILANDICSNEFEENTKQYDDPPLPPHLRKWIAMRSGPPESPPQQTKLSTNTDGNADPSLPSHSLTDQLNLLENSFNCDEEPTIGTVRMTLENVRSTFNWAESLCTEEANEETANGGTIEQNPLNNETESARSDDGELDFGNMTSEEQAAAMFRMAVLHQKPLSAENFLFLRTQIEKCINLKLGATKQMVRMLIESDDMSAEIGELTARCLQATAKNKGGKLTIAEVKHILSYFIRLPDPATWK